MIADGSLLAEPLPDRGVRGNLGHSGSDPALGSAAAAVGQFNQPPEPVTIKLSSLYTQR